MRATASVVLSYRIERGTLAEERERGVVPVTERFGGLRRIGLHKTGVAVRQVHRKEVDLALDPGDLRQSLAKIHLCMAGIVP